MGRHGARGARRPMGAGGAAVQANGRAVITQAARAGAWSSRARRLTTRPRDVSGAPPVTSQGRGRARSPRARGSLHSEQSMLFVCMPLYYFDSVSMTSHALD